MACQDRLSRSEGLINHGEETVTTVSVTEPAYKKTSLVDMTVLVRSIQRAEGNPDCFRRGQGNCPEMGCWWRPYCLEGQPL
jgi:hypothetical protein